MTLEGLQSHQNIYNINTTDVRYVFAALMFSVLYIHVL